MQKNNKIFQIIFLISLLANITLASFLFIFKKEFTKTIQQGQISTAKSQDTDSNSKAQADSKKQNENNIPSLESKFLWLYLKEFVVNLDALSRLAQKGYRPNDNIKGFEFLNDKALTKNHLAVFSEKLKELLMNAYAQTWDQLNPIPKFKVLKSKTVTLTPIQPTAKVSFDDYSPHQYVTMTNHGKETIQNLKFYNTRKDWTDIEGLAKFMKLDKPSEETALKIYDFLCKYVDHGSPASWGENHDPIKMIHVFGYGFCDDYAANLRALFDHTGGKSRGWGLNGHVVSEVYYDNGWHVFDCDHKAIYRKADGSVAGAQELMNDDSIILNSTHPGKMGSHRLYSTKHDNALTRETNYPSKIHKIRFRLRPRESFTWVPHRGKTFYASRYFNLSPKSRSGLFTYTPIDDRSIDLSGMNIMKGLSANPTTKGLELSVNDRAQPLLVCEFISPYPFLQGRVKIKHDAFKNGLKSIKVFFSRNQKNLDLITEIGPSSKDELIDFSSFLSHARHMPDYSFQIVLGLSGPANARATIKKLEFQAECQLSVESIPAISTQNNMIQADNLKQGQNLQVTYKMADLDL